MGWNWAHAGCALKLELQGGFRMEWMWLETLKVKGDPKDSGLHLERWRGPCLKGRWDWATWRWEWAL